MLRERALASFSGHKIIEVQNAPKAKVAEDGVVLTPVPAKTTNCKLAETRGNTLLAMMY